MEGHELKRDEDEMGRPGPKDGTGRRRLIETKIEMGSLRSPLSPLSRGEREACSARRTRCWSACTRA